MAAHRLPRKASPTNPLPLPAAPPLLLKNQQQPTRHPDHGRSASPRRHSSNCPASDRHPPLAKAARTFSTSGTTTPSRAICRSSRGKSPSGSTRSDKWKQAQALHDRTSRRSPFTRVARCWKCLTGFPRNRPSGRRSSIHTNARYGDGHSSSTESSGARSAPQARSSWRIAWAGRPRRQRHWA